MLWRKKLSDAVHVGSKLLKDSPDSLDVLGLMALALVGIDRHQQALRYLDIAKKIDINNAFVQLGFSFCAQAENQLKSVVYHLQKAVELEPKAWELRRRLGRVYLYLAQERESRGKSYSRQAVRSLHHLLEAIRYNPFLGKNHNFLRDIGLCCILNGF